ncbi:hypothetical protein Daus18300_013094 [Diaporthe australafricana]|uniref:Uncharacterized protein n=1 Tax=Diaporthe australafricana TaxID=127596 RepID=A0ABR3W0B5_9PEZI
MSSKSSAGNGASLSSTEPANHHGQTPSTDNSYHPVRPSGLASGFAVAGHREEPASEPVLEVKILNDVRDVCTSSQHRLLVSCQVIKSMAGVPESVSDAVVNDMRGTGHQFLTITQYCDALERLFNRNRKAHLREQHDRRASFEAHENGTRHQLAKANTTIDELNKRNRELEQLLAKPRRNTKSVAEARVTKLSAKVSNQKIRIKDQSNQIEDLKAQLGIGSKPGKKTALIKMGPASISPPYELPHSATSELEHHRRSPPVPRAMMNSAMDEENREFLLNNLKNMDIRGPKGFDAVHPAATRMERDNHFKRGPAPAPAASSYGPFGHQLAGAVGPTEPMYGAPGYYGGYRPAATHGNHNSGPPAAGNGNHTGYPPAAGYGNHTGYTPAPAYGNHAGGHPYGGQPVAHNTYGMPKPQPPASLARSRADPSGYTNALVRHRDDDSELDPRVDQFRTLFARLFGTVEGWTKDTGRSYVPGTAEMACRNDPQLWEYIKLVATCHKDRIANSNHALFLLRSPDHRAQFIARLMLQYIEQEMLRPKFWVDWSDETDKILETQVIPVLENAGHSFDQRRAARQQLAAVVSRILNDAQYSNFRNHAIKKFVMNLKSIAQPFFLGAADSPNAVLGLHSIINVAMEASSKMMTSCLSFSFIWDECGVKFSHNSHIALNENLHGHILQQKQRRVALVVSPSVSYRDDTPKAMVTRSVCKAEVMVMS